MDVKVADLGFPERGAPNPEFGVYCKMFTEKGMKIKAIALRGAHVPSSPLDPPMVIG